MIIRVKYSGKSVDDGSMSLSDVVTALDGFSSAYTKLALKNSSKHVLQVKAVNKGSFEILLGVLNFVAENQEVLTEVSKGLVATSGLIVTILKLVKLYKHLKNKLPKSVKPDGNGNLIISNSNNVTVVMAKEVYEVYSSGALKNDLAKVASPLEKGKIDYVEIASEVKGKKKMTEKINHSDKPFFETITKDSVQTKETSMLGFIVSLNKERNDGLIHLENGKRIKYRLVSDKPKTLYPGFLYKGFVKVKCVAHLDENFEVIHLDISHIEPIQQKLL